MKVLGSWLINFQKIDHGLSVVPTKEWQDNLSRCLASGSTPSSCTPDSEDGHVSQRRRLNGYCKVPTDWDSLLTIDNPDGTHKIGFFTYTSHPTYYQRSPREIRRRACAFYH